MIHNTVREERAPRFPRYRDSATGDNSHGLLHRLRLKVRHFCTGVCKSKCRKPCGWAERPPETMYAHPLKVHLWLDDPGVGKEAVHCLGQEELGRRAHLHSREKVIRVSFELMSLLPLKIFTSIY